MVRNMGQRLNAHRLWLHRARKDGFGLMDYNAHNNPIKYQDSSGHFIETVWDVANQVENAV